MTPMALESVERLRTGILLGFSIMAGTAFVAIMARPIEMINIKENIGIAPLWHGGSGSLEISDVPTVTFISSRIVSTVNS